MENSFIGPYYRSRALLFSLLLFVSPGRSSWLDVAGQDHDTLAQVGTRIISTGDLLNRIELMPWPGKQSPAGLDSSKIKALQSLVAEQLLSLEASATGIGMDTLTRIGRRALEKLLVRDELHRTEVRSKIAVTEEELNTGLAHYASLRTVLLAHVRSRREGTALARQLLRSTNPESTLIFSRPPLVPRVDTLSVTLGSADAAIEDTAFALSQERPVSQPVFSQYAGLIVLVLQDERSNPEFVNRSVPERTMNADREVRKRKETLLTGEYLAATLRAKRAEANPVLFEALASRMLSLVTADPERHRAKDGFTLYSADVDTLTIGFWTRRGEEFVTLEEGGISLGNVIEAFRSEDIVFPSLESREFRIRLNGFVKAIVTGELMAREGFRRNLQNTEVVQRDLGVWTNYWLAGLLREKITQSTNVSDDEILEYFVIHAHSLGASYQVNVCEVLSDNLPSSTIVLERLAGGTDIVQLARKESKRAEWRKRGGISGLISVSSYPEIGFHALAQDTGKLTGPVHLAEGYSVFKVLEKRHAVNDSVPGFDSLRMTIRSILLGEKVEQMVTRTIASTAKTYGVTMNYEKLSKVKVSPLTMFTRRRLGFGGIMTAVPPLLPQWYWVREWEKLKNELP